LTRVERLFTPGPTPIPERIRAVLGQPIRHHRTAEFTAQFNRVSEGLKPLFGTRESVLTLAASGTGGLEAAFANLVRSDRLVVTVAAGKFGERWTNLARAYRVPVAELAIPYGEACPPERLAEFLDAQSHTVEVVCLTQSETSTGVLHDVAELARVARERGALVLVDAITALAVHPIRMDDWGLDAVVAGSQKGLMLPPGLAFVALSDRARSAMPHSDLPRFYFDLTRAAKELAAGTTPFTPAITLVAALEESLTLLEEEGLSEVFARHARLAEACRRGLSALGLPLFAKSPSNGVTAIGELEPPVPEQLVRGVREQHGLRLTGGQGSMKGRIFRVGHMGAYSDRDIDDVVTAVKDVLAGVAR
jgi:aspartate aminotransferase-like enzyme